MILKALRLAKREGCIHLSSQTGDYPNFLLQSCSDMCSSLVLFAETGVFRVSLLRVKYAEVNFVYLPDRNVL